MQQMRDGVISRDEFLDQLFGSDKLRDAALTETGREQAAGAGRILTETLSGQNIDLFVVSPMTRTIETFLSMLRGAGIDSTKTPIFLQPLATEWRASTSEVGSEKSKLRKDFPEIESWLGYKEMAEKWWPGGADSEVWKAAQTEERYGSGPRAIRRRVLRFSRWLSERPERRICIVSHGMLLLNFLERDDLDGRLGEISTTLSVEERKQQESLVYNGVASAKHFNNCESRWYNFMYTGNGDEEAAVEAAATTNIASSITNGENYEDMEWRLRMVYEPRASYSVERLEPGPRAKI